MFEKRRHVFVYNKTKETFLAFRVEVCDSVWGRLRGLLGKRSLKPDSGVWIVPANAVHTVGMLFSFDLVLIDKNFKVVGLRELVRPFRITLPAPGAESVLELPAHSIFRSRTQIGDQLHIDRYEARKPASKFLEQPIDQHGAKTGTGDFEPRGQVVPLQPQSSKADSRRSSYEDTKVR
jgi:uncharacterized membrane protein (UPF0127 family)